MLNLRNRFLISGFILFCAAGLFAQKKEFKITEFGAKADGVTNNAASIQKAIDKASESGGGRVVIPPGNFASGTIELKNGTELYFEPGARLAGSVFRSDYDTTIALALITGLEAENISITGKGVIDGQAPELIKNIFTNLREGTLYDAQWGYKRPTEAIRPMLVHLVKCKNVLIKGITLKNSASWVQNYTFCNGLIIDSVNVESAAYWNNDGIDVSDSRNVVISNCFVNAADDGICLKSEKREGLCENIEIRNCKIRSSASAFKMGTASHGGFKNIKVRNLDIYDTYRSAVAIESVDGGIIENIDIRDIKAKNTGNAVFIRLGQRNTDVAPGYIKNVYIADLKAEIPLRKPDLGYPFEGPPDFLRYRYSSFSKKRPNIGYPFIGQPFYPYNIIPASIVGIPGARVQDVVLEDINITYDGGGDKQVAYISLDSLSKVPEKPADYPEFSMFWELPAWGFYVRHAEGITFKNMKLACIEEDYRPAFVFDDVKKPVLEEVEVTGPSGMPAIFFNNTEGKKLEGVKLPADAKDAIKEK
jgi:hypothetical protein